jgi:hypothetical protein
MLPTAPELIAQMPPGTAKAKAALARIQAQRERERADAALGV